MVLEEHGEEDEEVKEENKEEQNQGTLEDTGTISLQTIGCLSIGGIVRIKKSLEKIAVMILQDSGSSHSFMDSAMAEGL